ncbi:MAG: DUF488 family protein, N3 subclade [Candidatus Acidiferrales bacterium]
MKAASKIRKPILFTIGHSTRSLADFIALLRGHGVRRIIDIRSIPRSRHNPQFNGDTLGPALRSEGLAYTHLKKLGGLRHAKADSINTAWRNKSFRGFADYMQTREFAAGLEQAMKLAHSKTCALMCAEAVPWRCHRSLVADALLARGYTVRDILSASRAQPHKLTPFARVRGMQVTYPGEAAARPLPLPEGKRTQIRIARIYDLPGEEKSARFFVERLWPRGIKKTELPAEMWLKDVAPSAELRKWFDHRPERWRQFQKRYHAELRANTQAWKPVLEAARHGEVTLLYSARDREHNAALALQQFLTARLSR